MKVVQLTAIEAVRFVGDGKQSELVGRAEGGGEVRIVLPSQWLPKLRDEVSELLHQF